MNRELSAYFDFLRFFAALAVLLGHMEQDGLYMSWLPLSRFSHAAVIVFFVMSGFIIYSTTVNAGRNATDYCIARASRIYSVALPAVIFSTLCAWLFVQDIGPTGTYPSNYTPPSVIDTFSSLLFLNESWLNPSILTLNDPFWSLCYEVWYYVIFGLWLFVPGFYRWPAAILAALIAGPAIIALFPIWLAGAWLAGNYERLRFSLSGGLAALLFVLSLAVIVAIDLLGIDQAIKDSLHQHVAGFWRLEGSQRLITDFAIAFALLVNIVAFCYMPEKFRAVFLRFKNFFGYLAGFSFTLYLFHRPMTQLLGFYYPNTERSLVYSLLALSGLLLACLIISYVTERQLKGWRQLLRFILLRPA